MLAPRVPRVPEGISVSAERADGSWKDTGCAIAVVSIPGQVYNPVGNVIDVDVLAWGVCRDVGDDLGGSPRESL